VFAISQSSLPRRDHFTIPFPWVLTHGYDQFVAPRPKDTPNVRTTCRSGWGFSALSIHHRATIPTPVASPAHVSTTCRSGWGLSALSVLHADSTPVASHRLPTSVPPAVAGGAFLRYPYTIAPPSPSPSRSDDRDWLLTLHTLFTFHSPLSILNSTRALHPRQTITHTQKPNRLTRDEHQPPVRTGSHSDWVPIPRSHSSQSSLAPRSSRINDRYCDVV